MIFPGRLPGYGLSPLGKQQASRMAEFFSKKPISSVFASSLARTLETAKTIAQKLNLPVVTDKRLSEVQSPFDGLPMGDIEALAGKMYIKKYFDQGLERLPEIFRRMDGCLRDIVQKQLGEHIIVVSHGDPMMSVWFGYRGLTWSKGFAVENWYVPQASGFKIEFDAKGAPVRITKFP
jgi:probable phosphoglycerate mutase